MTKYEFSNMNNTLLFGRRVRRSGVRVRRDSERVVYYIYIRIITDTCIQYRYILQLNNMIYVIGRYVGMHRSYIVKTLTFRIYLNIGLGIYIGELHQQSANERQFSPTPSVICIVYVWIRYSYRDIAIL